MRCSLELLAINVVLGNVHHVSSELLHHDPLLAATNSAWGFGAMHSGGSSVLCSDEGHGPCHFFANTHTYPVASSRGWTKQTCAPEDGLPEHGSKQPHVLGLNTARNPPKFGGLHATSTLTHHVRAAHTHTRLASSPKLPPQSTSTRPTGYAVALSLPSFSPAPPLSTYHLPYMQALPVMGEMRIINMVLMLMLCSASLLLYVVTMRHNARGKHSPAR